MKLIFSFLLFNSWRDFVLLLDSWLSFGGLEEVEELKNLAELRAIYVMSFDDQTCFME